MKDLKLELSDDERRRVKRARTSAILSLYGAAQDTAEGNELPTLRQLTDFVSAELRLSQNQAAELIEARRYLSSEEEAVYRRRANELLEDESSAEWFTRDPVAAIESRGTLMERVSQEMAALTRGAFFRIGGERAAALVTGTRLEFPRSGGKLKGAEARVAAILTPDTSVTAADRQCGNFAILLLKREVDGKTRSWAVLVREAEFSSIRSIERPARPAIINFHLRGASNEE